MPKLWPARSPRTLLQIYCFQLLLLTWNCLYTGQPLRKFSNRHSLRSNFQPFQSFSERKFPYNSSNKLIQKVPITYYHQSSSVKTNQSNKSHLLEENCQIFRYQTNSFKQKANQLIHLNISDPKIDSLYTDKSILIIFQQIYPITGKIYRYSDTKTHISTTNSTNTGLNQQLEIPTQNKAHIINNSITTTDLNTMNTFKQTINNTNSDVEMEVHMETIPDLTIQRGCKRPAEYENNKDDNISSLTIMDIIDEGHTELHSIKSNNNQTTEMDTQHETVHASTPDTTWEELLPILQQIRDHDIPLPAADSLQAIVQDQIKTPTIAIFFEEYRQSHVRKKSPADIRFGSWVNEYAPTGTPSTPESLMLQQFYTVLRLDKFNALHNTLQQESLATQQLLRGAGLKDHLIQLATQIYSTAEATAQQALNDLFQQIHNSRAPTPPSLPTSMDQEMLKLEERIQQASPKSSYSSAPTDDNSFLLVEHRKTRTKRTTLGHDSPPVNRTADPLNSTPLLSYKAVPIATQNIGYATQQSIREAANRGILLSDTDPTTASIIEECTEIDSMLKWTQYLIVIGFSPVTSPNESLQMLQSAIDHIGNPEDGSEYKSGLVADQEYTLNMHVRRDWKVQRHIGTKNLQTGHIIKLTKRAIFGTFHACTSQDGNIFPAITRMRVQQGQRGPRSLYFQCLPEPIHLDRLQNPIKYPPLCALRGIPMNKDKHALTAAAMFAAEQHLLEHLPAGSFTIIPACMYHIMQPQPSPHKSKTPQSEERDNSPELLFEVIFLKTEDQISLGTNSDRFKKSRERIFATPKESSQSDPSHILITAGFKFEILASLDACMQHPARSLAYTASLCSTIHDIPEAMFAKDILRALANDWRNHNAIHAIASAIVIPPVQRARSNLPWRLLLLWEGPAVDIELDSTTQLLQPTPRIYTTVIPGYEQYFRLQSHYVNQLTRSLDIDAMKTATQPAGIVKTNNPTPGALMTPAMRPTVQRLSSYLRKASDNNPDGGIEPDGTVTTSWHGLTQPSFPNKGFFKKTTSAPPPETEANVATDSMLCPPRSTGPPSPNQSPEPFTQHNPMTDLVTTKSKPNALDSTAVTMMQGLTLEEYISRHINDKMQEQSKKLEEQIQEVRLSVTASMNSHIQTIRDETCIPVLRQRAENLSPQLIKFKKQYNAHLRAAKLHDGTPPEEWQENDQDLRLEHQRLKSIYGNIVLEALKLKLSPKELGLPDFPTGPA